jgi:hypothetical protein
MGAVRPIDELTVALDGCFSFIGPTSSVSIKYETPEGEVEFFDYDAFAHELGTIIRFESIPVGTNSIWSMNATIDSGEKYTIQWNTYEENFDIWENNELPAHKFLGFCKSVNTASIDNNTRIVKYEDRCDTSSYGPRIYFPTDGVRPSPIDLNLFSAGFSGFFPVVNVNGIGHVTSQVINKIGMTWRNWPAVTLSARTLSGMLRQLCEWRDLHIAGYASEEFAKDSHDFIEALGITESMIEELKLSEVPMPVERFMKGYGTPRHGFSETGNLPSSIKSHLKKQLRYKTLSSLESQHPEHPAISDDLKIIEISAQKETLFEFIVTLMPSVDPYSVDMEDVRTVINNPSGDGEDGAPPVDVGYSEIILKAKNAMRFFDATS